MRARFPPLSEADLQRKPRSDGSARINYGESIKNNRKDKKKLTPINAYRDISHLYGLSSDDSQININYPSPPGTISGSR